MSNLNKMLKQAQKMQRDVEEAQNDLERMELSYSNNGVDVVARGNYTIRSITIGDDLLKAPDKEIIEDVLLVAVNGALDQVRKKTERRLSGITAGLNLPGIF